MKKNKKILLNILIFIGLLFLICPEKISAIVTKSEKSSSDFYCKDGRKASEHCWSNYGIEIIPAKYDKNASYVGGGIYENNTKDRPITIKVNKAATYGVKIFHGPSGTVDEDDLIEVNENDGSQIKISKLKEKDVAKGLSLETHEIKNGSYTWKLPEGQDALIVVYLAENESLSCVKLDTKKKTDFNCISGKDKVVIMDKKKNIFKLGGISASEFVTNSTKQIEVANLRYTGNNTNLSATCRNASEGIYQKTDGTKLLNNQYTINEKNYGADYKIALSQYKNNIYDHLLGTLYCDRQNVAFNLSEKQIANLSNKLLRTFNKSWRTSHRTDGSNIKIKTAEEVEDIAKAKAEELKKENKLEGDLFDAKSNPNELIRSLSCDPKQENKAEKNYMAFKDFSVTKTLSDGHPYEICRTYCYELLTVKYDPPVASIAGICFTYKVTVQTKTECGVTDKSQELLNGKNPDSIIQKVKKEMCAPSAECDGNGQHTQAGPSEEFDNCIKECDDGKYTQSCINKCYSKVYKSSEKSSINKTTTNEKEKQLTINENKYDNNVVGLELINGSNSKGLLTTIGYTDDELEKYWKENNNKKCNWSNVMNNINECKKYYFYAKSLYPCGKYVINSKSKIIHWSQDTKGCNISNTSHNSIEQEIAKAAPFYIRDEESTGELIRDIINGHPNTGNHYRIDSEGIKKKWASGWKCSENCYFVGCDKSNAITPKQFVDGLKISQDDDDYTEDDIVKIEQALDECTQKSVCEETKTTTFDMVIENLRDSDKDHKVVVDGSNTSGKDSTGSNSTTTTDKSCGSKANNDFSMFVPETGVDKEDSNGILGICYGKDLDYAQYKTTITFPGSWINYKSRNIRYDTDCSDEYLYKPGLFCSAYDSTNVNANWFKWRTKLTNKDTKQPYEYADPEIKDNIKAYIGYEVDNSGNAKIKNKGFGEFNWHINYSCFYAIWDGVDNPPPPDCPDDCCDEHCYQSYKFKVIDQGKLFTKDSKQKQGYNWTSAAKIVAGISANSMTQTYGIDPQKYIEYLNKEEANEVIYDQPTSSDDYYIYIPSEGIDHIKSSYQKQKYTEFNGRFTEDPNIKGLLRYYSTLLDDIKGKDGIKIEAHNNARPSGGQGINNNYSNISQLK